MKKSHKKPGKEENMIDLPEVKDIPGQEHVRPPDLREMADTTISSAGEEGDDLFEAGEDEILIGTEANVTPEEIDLLESAGTDNPDDRQLKRAALDSTDADGDPLNEAGFGAELTGDDLDVPGSEEDDPDEAIGEEDEENNPYSIDEENEDREEK